MEPKDIMHPSRIREWATMKIAQLLIPIYRAVYGDERGPQ